MAPTNASAELVSVVIPAHNAVATIEATISSVLAQTYRHIELIVVDDGSTDGTAVLVNELARRDPRVTLVTKPNGGLAAARNTGIEHAHGDFVAPVDADDVWHPTKIEKQLGVMQRRGPQVGLVYCWSRAINQQGQIAFDLPAFSYEGDVFAALILWNFIQSGSPLFRRSLAVAAGGYDVSLAARGAIMCEDLKFNLNLAERCDFALVPEFLVGYRLHAQNMSNNTAEMLRSRCIVLDEVRVQHPELPASLFRWGRALNARSCSQVYLRAGEFSEALKLIVAGAAQDPVGMFAADAWRTLIGGLLDFAGVKNRLYRYLQRRKSVERPGAGVLLDRSDGGISFFTADPTKFYRAPNPAWRSARHRRVATMRTARLQAAR
jgi:glycosyltransferase involved in cell wall biosynthesis